MHREKNYEKIKVLYDFYGHFGYGDSKSPKIFYIG